MVEFTKAEGGIAYAEQYMKQQVDRAHELLEQCADEALRVALTTYVDYVVDRNK